MDVHSLVAGPESARLEKKSEWFDLGSAAGKGGLVKHVLALANSAAPDSPSHLVFGVADEKHGGGIVGLKDVPDVEQVAHVLKHHTRPVPDVRVHPATVKRKKVTILEIVRNDNWPYYSSRDIDGVLSSDVVYVRVGPTVSTLKPAELEQWIRQKERRVGSAPPIEALAFGFVELGNSSGQNPILRLLNRSGESLRDIYVSFDVVAAYDPTLFYRQPRLHGASLGPGEAREVECDLRSVTFYRQDGSRLQQGMIWSTWMNIMARVHYRDDLGFFRSFSAECQVR